MIAGILIGVCTACDDANAPAPNLIVISIDTLRADRVGAYGYEQPTTPALDALAKRGVLFENAFSTSTWTLPAHASLFSGRLPTAHRATAFMSRIAEEAPMLAEILQAADYQTHGITSGGFLNRRYGFDRGFDGYHDTLIGVVDTFSRARERIETFDRSAPFFLFVHTLDIHCPYTSPSGHSARFQRQPPSAHIATRGRCASDYLKMNLASEQVRFISDEYDAGVRHVDDQLGEFLSFLDARGELERTVLVVTSDHGDEFGEHGGLGHGDSLYVETLAVPLVVLAPGLEADRVDTHVSLVDLLPTLLDLLGLPAPEGDGFSLATQLKGEAAPRPSRPIFAEVDSTEVSLRSVRTHERHVILDVKSGTHESYDLTRDPFEQAPLASDPLSAALAQLLDERYLGDRKSTPAPTGDIAPGLEAELRALGYVE